MGNDLTRSDKPLAGVLIPDDRLEYWPEQSTNIDEAAPFAGAPVPARDTGMQLTTIGTPEDLDELQIVSQFAGFPGFNGAAFCFRASTVPAQDYRGWDSPSAISYQETPTWSTDANQGRRHLDVSLMPNDSLLVTCDFPNLGTWQRGISRIGRSSGGIWSAWSLIYQESGALLNEHYLYPTTVVRADESVELFNLTYDHESSTVNLMKWVSVNNGDTWELAQKRCLTESIDLTAGFGFEIVKMRIAYSSGQHCLVMETVDTVATHQIVQFASRDGGATFSHVGVIDTAGSPDIVSCGGFFILSYIDGGATHRTRRISSGYSSFDDAETVDVGLLGHITAIAASDSDELYALAYSTVSQSAEISRSSDYAASWEVATLGQSYKMRPFSFETQGIVYPTMCWWRGALSVVANNHGTSIAGRNSLTMYLLGGFSTVTMPPTGYTQVASQQMSWTVTYQPYDTLDTVTSAVATLDASTVVTVSDGFQRLVNLAAAPTESAYAITGNSTIKESSFRGAFSTSVGRSSIYVRSGTGVNGAEVEARLDTSGLQIFDTTTALQLGATVVLPASTDIDLIVAVNASTLTASAWYRERGPGIDERAYTEIINDVAVADSLGPGIAYGDITQSINYVVTSVPAGPYSAKLIELNFFFNHPGGGSGPWDNCGRGLSGGFVNPDDLNARNYTLKPTYCHDSVSISATGITRRGDSFTVPPAHRYAATNARSIESPRTGWRSLTTTGNMAIAYRFPEETRWTNDLIAVYLDKINFKDFDIEIRQSGIWVNKGSFSTAYAVGYDTIGDSILPQTAAANLGSRRTFYQNELVGGTFEYPGSIVRPIVRNLPGIDDAGAPVSKRTAYYIAPTSVTGAEPAGPATGASVWYPRAVAMISLNGDRDAQGIRIVVRPGGSSTAPYSGDYRIGQIVIGAVSVLGWAPDNTRSTSVTLADQIIEEADGTRSISQFGRVDRRRVEISWARSSRQTEIQTDTSPNYVVSCGDVNAEPTASRFGTPIEFTGLLRQHGKNPLVYLPFFSYQDPATQTLTAHYCRGAIYGRAVIDSYRVETAAGIPELTETVRTSVVTIEEET